jgi:hypothetical protein
MQTIKYRYFTSTAISQKQVLLKDFLSKCIAQANPDMKHGKKKKFIAHSLEIQNVENISCVLPSAWQLSATWKEKEPAWLR